MRFSLKRFVEEFFLYSSQLVVFFIIMLFLTPTTADALGILPLIVISIFLVVQIGLLASQGHNPILRFLFSFISPGAYALVRVITGDFAALDMANIFLWGAAFYVGLFQSLSLATANRWLKRVAETFLALGAVLVFTFFYYYLDLRLGTTKSLQAGDITVKAYEKALSVASFAPSFLKFHQEPPARLLDLRRRQFRPPPPGREGPEHLPQVTHRGTFQRGQAPGTQPQRRAQPGPAGRRDHSLG